MELEQKEIAREMFKLSMELIDLNIQGLSPRFDLCKQSVSLLIFQWKNNDVNCILNQTIYFDSKTIKSDFQELKFKVVSIIDEISIQEITDKNQNIGC